MLLDRVRIPSIGTLIMSLTMAGSIFLVNTIADADSSISAHKVNVVELTVQEIKLGYDSAKFTAEDLAKAYLERINIYEPHYNAFISLNPNVLEDARDVDRRRFDGENLGELAGIPIIIKDSIDVAGLPTTAGWAPLSKEFGGIEIIPEYDAPVVSRLREAGVLIIGKGNIPALSASGTNADSSWAGPTYNAVNSKFVPGGSSSGVATAVSASFVTLGLAEETGGSIQNPASAQSLVSLRPTFGLVPSAGVVPLGGSTLDVLGPHSKTVYEAAVMLDVIAGYSIADPKTVAAIGRVPSVGYTSGLELTALSGKRIGTYGLGWSGRALSPEIQHLYERAITTIEDLGAIKVSDPFFGTEFEGFVPKKSFGRGYGGESWLYDLDNYFKNLGSKSNIKSLESLITILEKNNNSGDLDFFKQIWKEMTVQRSQLEDLGYFDSLNVSNKRIEIALEDVLQKVKDTPITNSQPDLSEFTSRREKYLKLFNEIMDKNNLDALIFPQIFREIPLAGQDTRFPMTSVPQVNILGLPAVTVPAGYTRNGAPLSLIFIGRKWTESLLLSMGYSYEQSTKHRITPTLKNENLASGVVSTR